MLGELVFVLGHLLLALLLLLLLLLVEVIIDKVLFVPIEFIFIWGGLILDIEEVFIGIDVIEESKLRLGDDIGLSHERLPRDVPRALHFPLLLPTILARHDLVQTLLQSPLLFPLLLILVAAVISNVALYEVVIL